MMPVSCCELWIHFACLFFVIDSFGLSVSPATHLRDCQFTHRTQQRTLLTVPKDFEIAAIGDENGKLRASTT